MKPSSVKVAMRHSSQKEAGRLGPVSLGEMMLSAANQVRLFNNLEGAYDRYLGVYEEAGMNLIRLGHTEEEEERAFLQGEIDAGLKYLRRRDKEIQKGAKALGELADAFDLVARKFR
jgi:hypothetical protein